MPLFWLDDSHDFPQPGESIDGLIAVGGDLSPERILAAYKQGIFPWFSDSETPLWWSPDPRMILLPEHLKISKSMHQILRKNYFRVELDTRFDEVIDACGSTLRKHEEGTWITSGIKQAYGELHKMGHAHSVEVLNPDGQLVGGLYGVAIGGCFFGESMFTKENNASKVAFVSLVRWLQTHNFRLIDCQVHTNHLMSLGAHVVPREMFLSMLGDAMKLHVDLPAAWKYEG